MARLTKLEGEMLRRSAELVLAGEWPWEDKGAAEETPTERRERAALTSARDKLQKALGSKGIDR